MQSEAELELNDLYMAIANFAGVLASEMELEKTKRLLRQTKQGLREIAISGLLTDEGHHKQFYLEQIMITLGFDLTELRAELNTEGYDWEEGIAP